MPQPKIKVFWDLESCRPPQSYDSSPWNLLKAIRLFVLGFGTVTSFRAYRDSNYDLGGNSDSLLAAVPSMGIHLVDCALVKEYGRDALARTLAVEVLVSAIDDPIDLAAGPDQDIIMIFSGDKGILHPISLMMLRGYAIYLVVPDQNSQIEPSRATRVFNWSTDVLDIKSSRSPVLTPVLTTTQPSLAGAGSNAPRIKTNVVNHPREREVPPHLMTPPVSAISDMARQQKSPKASIGYPLSPPRSLSSSMSLNTSRAPTAPATPKTKLMLTISESSSSRTPSSLGLDTGTPPPSLSSWGMEEVHGIIRQSKSQLAKAESGMDDWGANNGWNEGGEWEMTGSHWSTEPEKKSDEPRSNIVGTTGLAVAHLNPHLSQYPVDKSEAPLEGSKIDHSVFLPLLQCLEKAKAEGKDQVLRSIVGEELSKNKDIYRAAGTTAFSMYVALAASEGLVNLGGTGGKAWVALK